MEDYHKAPQVKPQRFYPNAIPHEMRRIPQWMGTRFEQRADGRVDKPPYRVGRGRVRKASKTDPENWSTYAEAAAALERGDVAAIGFVFCETDPFFVVDLDGVIDLETGEIDNTALDIIHALDSYTELSCSGTGVHIIAGGAKPEWAGCKSKALGPTVEVYDRASFVVLTGSTMSRRRDISLRQLQLTRLCQKLWPKKPEISCQQETPEPVDLDDRVLLERARTARSGPKVHKLYDLGDTSGYGSPSDADYALINALIFWTAGDRDRIIRLFEGSALYRPKEKHRNYVALSVDNGLASYAGAFYRPRSVEKVREESEATEDPLTPYLKLLLDPSAWRGRKGASAYKTYAAAVALAAEHGVFDDEGNVRIGCDTRRLAEAAGTRQQTVCESGLPTLVKMKLLRWKRGRGTKSSVFLLPNPGPRPDRVNKVSTHFNDTVSAPPKKALETLRLLVRMRHGYAKHDTLLKLGMPAMFVAVALAGSGQQVRGYTAAELAERTGRRVRALEAPDGPLRRLEAAGVVQETRAGFYRFTEEFAANYERALEYSGITYAEREQRRRHARAREARDAKLQPNKRPARLRGREQMSRLLKKWREEAKRRDKTASREGVFPAPGEVQQRIARLIREGMSAQFARRAVLVPDHDLDCECEVCGVLTNFTNDSDINERA